MTELYTIGYIIMILVTYIIVKLNRPDDDWAHILATLFMAVVWPFTGVAVIVIFIFYHIVNFMESHKPPKWL